MPNYETTRLINSILTYYYIDGLTQAEIAKKMDLSTTKVNRLFHQAHELGYVNISIQTPMQNLFDLESRLQKECNINEIIVIPSVGENSHSQLSRLGVVAAEYLLKQIKDGDVIGIGGGTAVEAVTLAIEPDETYDISVVPMLGGVQGQITTDVNFLATSLANRLGGTAYQLHAPAFVDTKEHCKALLEMSPVKEIIEIARKSTIALFGIGTVDPDASRFVQFTALSAEEMDRIAENCGGTGEISAIVYDEEGRACAQDYNERVVGLSLEMIKSIPFKIGVAASAAKAEAILGALRGGYMDVLITDEDAAVAIIDLIEQSKIDNH